MKMYALIASAIVAASAPAFAGRGAGGVHSNDASNLRGYQAREAQEREEEARKARGEAVEERKTDAEVEADRKHKEAERVVPTNPRH